MRAHRAALIVACVCASACVRQEDLSIPVPSGALKTQVLVFNGQGGLRLIARSLEGGAPPPEAYTLNEATTIVALYYDRSIEALQMGPGEVAYQTTPGRAFPEPTSAQTMELSGGREWVSGVPAGMLDAIYLPELDPVRCASAGGCMAPPDGARFCTVPCPDPGAPEPPRVPELPQIQLSTCSDGSARVHSKFGDSPCEPPPSLPRCAPGTAQFQGSTECRQIGPPCPTGQWAENLPPDPEIIFVSPGAMQGTGARASPYGSILEALQHANYPAVLALAQGNYSEPVTLLEDVTLWGACAGGTILSPSIGPMQAAIAMGGPDHPHVHLAQMTVGGAGIAVYAEHSTLELDAVELVGPGGWGLFLLETDARASQLAVRDREGFGIATATGALSLEQVSIEGTAGYGMLLNFTVTATVTGLVIRDPRPTVTLDEAAVSIANGAHLDARGVLIEGAIGMGVAVTNPGTRARFQDLVMRDVQPKTEVLAAGQGFSIGGGGSAIIERALLARSYTTGVAIQDAGTATISAAVIREVRPRASNSEAGSGVDARSRARVSLHGVLIEDTRSTGVTASELSTQMVIEDAIVRRARAAVADESDGACVLAFDADLSCTRVLAEDCDDAGFNIVGFFPGGVRTISDISVRNSGKWDGHSFGRGHGIIGKNCQLAIDGAAVEDSAGMGLILHGDGEPMRIIDVSVRRSARGGIDISGVTDLELHRILSEDNLGFGMHVTSATLDLQRTDAFDVMLRGSTPCGAPCGALAGTAGVGLHTELGGALRLTQFQLAENSTGILIETAAAPQLSEGMILDNMLGARVLEPRYDLHQLTGSVLFRGNQQAITRE